LGNLIQGGVVAMNNCGNLLWNAHGTLATPGLENMVVVQTRDVTLVCHRDQAAGLTQLIERVKRGPL
jgi:mannose-1-phosphate guanylyltransferase/mannose-6-phosphate isomerase